MKKSYPLRIDEKLFDKFQVVAEKNHRSIAGHIAYLIEKAIAEYELNNGKIIVDSDNLNE